MGYLVKKKNRGVILSYKFLFIFKCQRLQKKIQPKLGKTSFGFKTIMNKGPKCFNKYRLVNYYYNPIKLPGVIVGHDLHNYSNIILCIVKYFTGSFCYVPAINKSRLGTVILISNIEFKGSCVGVTQPLLKFPIGSIISNIELKPQLGAVLSRSAGTFAKVLKFLGSLCVVELPSKHKINIDSLSLASFGKVGNGNKNLEKKKRYRLNFKLGKKPVVRGEAKNPVDHPHGGTTRGGKPRMNP
jgi:large subunit ribosomal protein L2